MPDDVQLLVNGRIYSGWEDIAVTRAIDAASGAFSLKVTERWADDQDTPWPIVPGDACEVRIDGETIITGYVDIFAPSFSATAHSINIQGRDKTADMIDCSAVHDPDSWSNYTVLDLARVLAAPFGIAVRADVSVGDKFSVVKLQQGETAFEALERHCRLRKLLLMPDGNGGLLITRTGTQRASVALVQGENIKSASGRLDYSQRFSQYTVKAQSGFSIETDGEGESHIVGGTSDPGVRRYRPMLVIAEGGGTTQTARDRAVWECNTRIGRSASASIEVHGWRQRPGGSLWLPNQIVSVHSSWMRMAGEMLIKQVTYKRDLTGGTTASLDIVSPQAYLPEPPKAESSGGSSGGSGPLWSEVFKK